MFLLPHVLYFFRTLPLPILQLDIATLQRIINHFIWAVHKPPHQVLFAQFTQGLCWTQNPWSQIVLQSNNTGPNQKAVGHVLFATLVPWLKLWPLPKLLHWSYLQFGWDTTLLVTSFWQSTLQYPRGNWFSKLRLGYTSWNSINFHYQPCHSYPQTYPFRNGPYEVSKR